MANAMIGESPRYCRNIEEDLTIQTEKGLLDEMEAKQGPEEE